VVLNKQKKFEQAIEKFEQAIKIDKNCVQAYIN
jgi:tetratricopeptide (TPR) repeat protein